MVDKRAMVPVVIGATCVLMLAACASSSQSNAGGKGSSGKTVLICNVEDLSGTQGPLGVSENQGAQVAIDQINAAGGIKSLGGAKLVSKNFDTQTKTDQGPTQATKAVQAGCKAVWGGEITDTVIPATAVTHRAGIPWMDIGGTGNKVTERGYNDIFQIISSTTLANEYAAIVKYVAQKFNLSNPTIGLSVSDTTYGQQFYGAWKPLNTFKVATNVTYPLNTTDLSSIAARMVSSKPDILFNMGYPPDGVTLGRLFKETFHPSAKAFLSTAQSAVAMKELGAEAEGQLFSSTSPPVVTPTVQKFNSDYQAKFNTAPAIEAWQGYLSVTFIALGLEKAGSTDGKALSTAMHSVSLSPSNGGLYPETMSFAADGKLQNSPYYWQQVQNGKLVLVYPDNVKQADMKPYSG